MMKLQLRKVCRSLEMFSRSEKFGKLEEVPRHKHDQHLMGAHFLESSLAALANLLCFFCSWLDICLGSIVFSYFLFM